MFSCNFNSPIIPFRVLLVDDDSTHLSTVENILLSFGYEVKKIHSPEAAHRALQRNNYMSDILVCGVSMSDLYAHRLVRFAGLELDIPVILMSLDCSHEFAFHGILNGASKCLAKPIQPEDLKNIWQIAVSKRRNLFALCSAQIQAPVSVNSAGPLSEIFGSPAAAIATAAHGGGPSCSNPKPNLKKIRQEAATTDPKKRRLIWTDENNKIFLDAIKLAKEFGKVVPTKILEYMRNHGLPNITRENVASRLQKYRLCIRKLEKNNEIYGSSKLSNSQPCILDVTNGENLMSFSENQTLSIKNNIPSSCSTPNLPPSDETLFLDKNMDLGWNTVVDDQGIVPTADFDQNMNNASKVSQENGIPPAMEPSQPPQIVPLEQDKDMFSVTNDQLLPPILSDQIFDDVDGNNDPSNKPFSFLEDYEVMYLNDYGNGFL